AVRLARRIKGVDPSLSRLGSKSGGRKGLREAGVELPLGFEDLRTEHDVETALVELKARRPRLRRAVVKLNESFSGEGNGVVRLPDMDVRGTTRLALREIEFAVPTETPDLYFEKLARMGGIVEEFIEAPEKASPSAQMRIGPTGEVLPISTHDQLLGGATGQVFLGCVFPADASYRLRMQEEALKIGRVLAAHGVVSRFGVDFLVWRNDPAAEWSMAALEI